MNFRDIELLSAYLDGRLTPPEAARLEARLAADTRLKGALDELRDTRLLLRRLPQRRAPRNFRLTPKMAGVRPPEPRVYPVFRFATALAALLFVVSVALNAFVPFAASRMAAPAPAYGMGGGGGGGMGGGPVEPQGTGPIGGGAGPGEQEWATASALTATAELSSSMPAATQAPLQAPFAAAAPTATLEPTMSIAAVTEVPPAADTARAGQEAQETGPAEAAKNTGPATSAPIPMAWIIGLAVAMLVFGVAAWWLRSANERSIRDRWNHK